MAKGKRERQHTMNQSVFSCLWIVRSACCVFVCVCRRRCYQKAMAGVLYQWELVDRWALIPNTQL